MSELTEPYGSFCGPIDKDRAEILKAQLNFWTKFKRVHVLWNCSGGEIASGLAIHAYFKAYPSELMLYASQAVSSGAIAFLGARNRFAQPNAEFMIHGVVSRFPDKHDVTIQELTETLEMALWYNDRVDDVINDDLPNLAPSLRSDYRTKEIRFNVSAARKAGFLTVQDGQPSPVFSPASGAKIFTLGRDPNDIRSGLFI